MNSDPGLAVGETPRRAASRVEGGVRGGRCGGGAELRKGGAWLGLGSGAGQLWTLNQHGPWRLGQAYGSGHGWFWGVGTRV